jgi:hypothetical protein
MEYSMNLLATVWSLKGTGNAEIRGGGACSVRVKGISKIMLLICLETGNW